jgi:hypothetical protein
MIVPQRFEEIQFHFARGSAYISHNFVAMLYAEELASYVVSDGSKKWAVHGEAMLGMAHDSDRNEIVLTTGVVVNAGTGKAVRELTPLEKCSSVGIRPGGGYVGISTSGMIRLWEEVTD